MRRVVHVFALAALLACAREAGPAGGSSGVLGRVIAYPTCPVEIEASPCPTKGVATTVVFESEDGERLHRVRTEPDGTFRAPLAPGDYLVSAQPPPGDPTLIPRSRSVTVEAGEFVRVTVFLDTRLREPASE